jgi:hypothetical protein
MAGFLFLGVNAPYVARFAFAARGSMLNFELGRPMSEIRCGGDCVDFFGGASLGALLGLLIGLSTTPVVSIVITGLVALLAGF